MHRRLAPPDLTPSCSHYHASGDRLPTVASCPLTQTCLGLFGKRRGLRAKIPPIVEEIPFDRPERSLRLLLCPERCAFEKLLLRRHSDNGIDQPEPGHDLIQT